MHHTSCQGMFLFIHGGLNEGQCDIVVLVAFAMCAHEFWRYSSITGMLQYNSSHDQLGSLDGIQRAKEC